MNLWRLLFRRSTRRGYGSYGGGYGAPRRGRGLGWLISLVLMMLSRNRRR